MTPEEAIAAWKAANPHEQIVVCVSGECGPISEADYELMAADRGQMWLDRVQAEEAEADWRQTVQQFTNGMATLESNLAVINAHIANNTTITQAQLRVGLRDIYQAVIWLGKRIEDGTIVIRRPD